VLLAHALACRRIELYTRHDEIPAGRARDQFRELIRRRVEGCPVAYLVGRKEFFALEFEVGPAVLIPRPDSELVVIECLRLAKPLRKPRVLDLGTGSGNLAVAIAHGHKGADVTAVDVSGDALAVATRNAERHKVGGRVRFLQGDLFGSIPTGERFDFIVSNPPYIARDEIPNLPAGVRDYEPVLALDGGVDGYEVFNRIATDGRDFLAAGGHLIVEIGAPQETHARQIISSLPGFQLAATIHDYSGHPRVIRAHRQP
jgi:release factor glutamine methyltransferase